MAVCMPILRGWGIFTLYTGLLYAYAPCILGCYMHAVKTVGMHSNTLYQLS